PFESIGFSLWSIQIFALTFAVRGLLRTIKPLIGNRRRWRRHDPRSAGYFAWNRFGPALRPAFDMRRCVSTPVARCLAVRRDIRSRRPLMRRARVATRRCEARVLRRLADHGLRRRCLAHGL